MFGASPGSGSGALSTGISTRMTAELKAICGSLSADHQNRASSKVVLPKLFIPAKMLTRPSPSTSKSLKPR